MMGVGVEFRSSEGETFTVDQVSSEYKIAPHFVYSMFMHFNNGTHPGSFLTAVLRNDLYGAVSQGDSKAMDSLPGIVRFLYNRAGSHYRPRRAS